MGFTIPSNDVAGVPARQSVWYDTDIAILVAGDNGVGVLTGCAVTAQGSPDMTVAVAAGTIQATATSSPVTVTAGNATISTADATNPRIDLVSASATGTKTVTAGTAAAAPKPPALPSGHIALAMVDVPANDTTIATAQITDKRVTVVAYVAPGLANVLVSTGDLVYMGAQGTDYVRSLTSDKFTSYYSGSWSEAGDGNDSTYKRLFAASDEYARVDLGTAQPVGFFRIRYSLTIYPDMSWVLQSSDDNSNWTTRASHTDDGISGVHDTGILALAGGPFTHRYWRQYPNAGKGGYRDMFTFSLFGPASAVALTVGADNTVLRVATDVPAWEAEFDATVPTTQAFGDAADAGDSATAARRNHKHGMPDGLSDVGVGVGFVGCKVKRTSAEPMTTSDFTALPFDDSDSEVFDADGFHSVGTNPSRLTIPAGLGGKYLCTATVFWDIDNDAGIRAIAFRVDGAGVFGRNDLDIGGASSSLGHTQTATTVLDLSAGQYVTLDVYHSIGGALDVDADTEFAVIKLDVGHVGQGVGAKAYKSASQGSLAASSYNALTLDTELFDTDGFHSVSSNTARMTVPAGLAGKYLVHGFGFNTAGACDLYVMKNGNGAASVVGGATKIPAVNTGTTISTVVDLAAGDYVQLSEYHASGTQAMGGTTADIWTTFSIMRIDSVPIATIANDTLWDAKGDLAGGTAANAASRLPVGANGSSLIAASGETTGLKWQLNNLGATAAPTANEDSGDGYGVGSIWVDVTGDAAYICVDATLTAAVWKLIG